MKHVERRHFFIRDMVESFEIEVPFVRTDDNLADFFTKPMKSASKFHAMRKIRQKVYYVSRCCEIMPRPRSRHPPKGPPAGRRR